MPEPNHASAQTDEVRRTRPPFALVPEWIIDAEISDGAVRLYVLLDRYAGSNGRAWPGRDTLARRLRCSERSVDRYVGELRTIGALTVVQRGLGRTNVYTVLDRPPAGVDTDVESAEAGVDSGVEPESTAVSSAIEKSERDSDERDSDRASKLDRALVLASQCHADLIVLALDKYLDGLGVKHRVAPKWYDDARLMIERDKRAVEDVVSVLCWVFERPKGEFWRANIHSPAKLREKFDTLRMQRDRDHTAGRPKSFDVLEAELRRLA